MVQNIVYIFGGMKVTDMVEYQIYHQMKQRCYNINHKKFPQYGGRGIIICDRWLEPSGKGYLNFIEDMGRRPDGQYSIERINVNRNYEPTNCIWVTMTEQTTNKTTTAIVKEGDVFGKLTIIKEVEGKERSTAGGKIRRMFLCRCSCGNETIKRMDKLRQGKITSCGLKPCNKYSNIK